MLGPSGSDELDTRHMPVSFKCTCVPAGQVCPGHTAACVNLECLACGERDCPHGEPLHYHHDGCPACVFEEGGDNAKK